MKYGNINYVDKKVSHIFYGTAMNPFMTGEGGEELFDSIYSLGVNAFDTARDYGLAEKALGTWIEKRGLREEVVILSKCGHPDKTTWRKRINDVEIREDLATSLSYLKTDYIDIYLMHRDDTDVPVGKIAEIFNALIDEGKIKSYGGSNWSYERVKEINAYANDHGLVPMTVSSPHFGLAEQVRDLWGGGCLTITGKSNANARDFYKENQMPIIAYSSLGRGFMSGRVKFYNIDKISDVLDEFAIKGYTSPENYERLRRCELLAEEKNVNVSQLAMAWLYNQPQNVYAIVSTSSAERMKSNIEAMDIKLTDEESKYLNLEIDKL